MRRSRCLSSIFEHDFLLVGVLLSGSDVWEIGMTAEARPMDIYWNRLASGQSNIPVIYRSRLLLSIGLYVFDASDGS